MLPWSVPQVVIVRQRMMMVLRLMMKNATHKISLDVPFSPFQSPSPSSLSSPDGQPSPFVVWRFQGKQVGEGEILRLFKVTRCC